MRSFLLAATAVLLLAAPARADDLGDLLDRHRAWRGGDAFEAMHGLSQEATISSGGFDGTLKLLVTDRPALRQDVDLGTFRTSDAWSGEAGWTLTTAGQVEDLSTDIAEDLRRQAALQFEGLLDDRSRLSLRPAEQFDGNAVAVVRVGFGDADTYDLLLDPTTGELRALRTVIDRRESVTRYSDWRMVEGVRLPGRAVTRDNTGRDTIVTLTSADVNPPVAADAFARPAVEARHLIAGGARSTRPIPIDLYAGVRIFLPGTVQGRETPVLLDSGAEMTVLDRGFAESLGLNMTGDLPAVGTGGVASAQIATGVTIQVGDLTLKDMTVAVIDLAEIGRRVGRPLPVILGKDAFNALAIDIDLPARQLIFHEGRGYSPPPGAVAIPLVETQSGRAVAVSIEGGEPVPFDFDTGNGGSLLIFPAYAEARGLAQGRPSSTVLSGAVGGERQSTVVSIRSLSFAGIELRDIPAVLPPAGPSAVDSDRTFGNIGMGILGRFRMITDFATDQLWLAPDPAQISRPFARDRLGLTLVAGAEAIEVRFVSANSPAAAAGWKAGDRIAAIDGTPAAELGADVLRTIVAGPEGRVVRFRMTGGEERSLTARSFY